MKLEDLLPRTQDGLFKWAQFEHGDDMFFDGIGSIPEQWAWVWFQLRAAEDRPEWFPSGKWATLQAIEAFLDEEARAQRK